MRPLVAVRRAVPFDPQFITRNAHFWPLARAAKALAGQSDFPPVEVLAGVFDDEPPVRFVLAPPRRRRGTPVDVRALYDARITVDRVVPTRPRCWHDLMNALVWGAFPLAKRALHARQYRAWVGRLTTDTRVLPSTRTPEQDAMALLDEGGVVVFSRGRDAEASLRRDVIVFGHAIYESLVYGVAPAVVAAISLPMAHPDAHPHGECSVLRSVDRALAAVIDDEAMLRSPRTLHRLRIPIADATA